MKVVKKLLIYLGIAFLVLMISLDSFVITYGDFSFTFLIRIFVWAALIVLLLYLDGGWFVKKNQEEIKYSKTKSRIILISSSVLILFVGFLIFGEQFYSSKESSECKVNKNSQKIITKTFCIGNVRTSGEFPGEYTGEFNNGMKNGNGILNHDDGSVYEGEFKNDFKNGKGKLTTAQGTIYVGDFKDDAPNGIGEYNYYNGDKYFGEVSNYFMEGYGKYKYKDGLISYYEGEFKNRLPDGEGIMMFRNGDKYTGQFKKNKFNGQGTYLYANGDNYTGTYQEGNFIKGKITKQNGEIEEIK